MPNKTTKLVYPSSLERDFIGKPDAAYMMIFISDTRTAGKLESDKSKKVNIEPDLSYTSPMGDISSTDSTLVDERKILSDDPVARIAEQEMGKLSLRKSPLVNRLNRVVVLPMPNDLVMGTSVSYESINDGSYMGGAQAFLDSIAADGISGVAKSILGRAGKKAVSKLSGSKYDELNLQRATQSTINPRKEMYFESLGFRGPFSFTYQMAPRSLKEYEAIKEIERTFRYYMLPDRALGGYFYTIPAEFEIRFMLGADENTTLPKIARCVMSRCSVNYTPKSRWSNLENGFPTEVTMTIEFKEIEIIDRTRVYNTDSNSALTSGF